MTSGNELIPTRRSRRQDLATPGEHDGSRHPARARRRDPALVPPTRRSRRFRGLRRRRLRGRVRRPHGHRDVAGERRGSRRRSRCTRVRSDDVQTHAVGDDADGGRDLDRGGYSVYVKPKPTPSRRPRPRFRPAGRRRRGVRRSWPRPRHPRRRSPTRWSSPAAGATTSSPASWSLWSQGVGLAGQRLQRRQRCLRHPAGPARAARWAAPAPTGRPTRRPRSRGVSATSPAATARPAGRGTTPSAHRLVLTGHAAVAPPSSRWVRRRRRSNDCSRAGSARRCAAASSGPCSPCRPRRP